MAFTLAQSITEVRNLLNEDTPAFWSDTQITSWIRQGVLDWCKKSLLFQTDDTIALVSGQTAYNSSVLTYINNALRTMHAVYNGTALQRVTYEQIYKHNAATLGGSTIPKYYFDHYNGATMTLYISPTPGVAENTEILTLFFAARDNDITNIPWEYQQTIFLYAAHKAKFRERQYQEAYLYYQQYINNIVFDRQDGLMRGIQPVDAFRIK